MSKQRKSGIHLNGWRDKHRENIAHQKGEWEKQRKSTAEQKNVKKKHRENVVFQRNRKNKHPRMAIAQGEEKRNLHQKLERMIFMLVVPLVLCLVVLLGILAFYASRYTQITYNINVSSKFRLSFKEDVDLQMYHYCIGGKNQPVPPFEQVDEAIEIAQSLLETANRPESRKAIQNVLNYCESLREKIINIQQTTEYDSRMEQLNGNIYVLTRLIKDQAMDFIYYEAGVLSDTGQKMIWQVVLMVIFMALLSTILVMYFLHRSRSLAKEIAVPVKELCQSVNLVGQGEFHIAPVETNVYEIGHLNDGIIRMARQIYLLLENVKKEEEQKHQLQLQLLQEQINPHFLYNTLDTIIWLVESDMHQEAIDMLTNLSIFFRTTLSKGANIITLKEEVEHVRSYLDIQQVRYQDIMSFRIALPENLEDLRLPKLTLQPLVENALYHGVKEKRGTSTIQVLFEEEGDNLCISVVDDGIGITKERMAQLKEALAHESKVGFGLLAVNDRLRLCFGEDYRIRIFSEYGKGTTVKFWVPLDFERRGQRR